MSGYKRGPLGVRQCWASGCRAAWPCKAHGFQAAYSGNGIGRTPDSAELVPGEHFWRCRACKFYVCSCKPPEALKPAPSGWAVADAFVYRHATLKNEAGSPAVVLKMQHHWETNSRVSRIIYATAEEAMRAAEKLFAKPSIRAGWRADHAEADWFWHESLKNEEGIPALVRREGKYWVHNSRRFSSRSSAAELAMGMAEKLFALKPAEDVLPEGWSVPYEGCYRHASGLYVYAAAVGLGWYSSRLEHGAPFPTLAKAMAAALGGV